MMNQLAKLLCLIGYIIESLAAGGNLGKIN